MTYTWIDLLGNIGVALIIGPYLLLQTGHLEARGFGFSLLNALGALLILVSLLDQFNLSAFVIEAFWLVISVYGLWRVWRARG
jgi:hypothetical protein